MRPQTNHCTPVDATAFDGLDASRLREAYRRMLIIREVEESIAAIKAEQRTPGTARRIKTPCHLYTGQEAVAAGVCANLNDADMVFSTHRSHGHFLAKGGSVEDMLAEVFTRAAGCSGGRGGSMHLCDPAIGFPGSSAIVGGSIPLAVGAGMAFAVRGEPHVGVTFFGEGAASEGSFAESLNFAALNRYPVLFVLENNGYSTHLGIEEIQAEVRLHCKGEACAMESVRIDGNNLAEVMRESARLIERARRGEGPALLECMTYRWRGHVDDSYDIDKGLRDEDELREWMGLCPLSLVGEALTEAGVLHGDEAQTMAREVAERVQRGIERAETLPEPDPATLHDNLYAEPRR